MLTRRHLIALSAAPALAPNLFIRVARAQTPKADFPNKPVRLIVPVAAGGPTDIVARMLAEKLSKMWGQQVVVENKGGAGTNIGNESYARSGQVRVLATTGAKRDAAAPDVPTIAEAGVRGYDVTAWQALFVPAKTPPAIVRKISADTNTALADPAIKDKLAQTGYLAEGSSSEELGQLLKSEIAKWSAVIKSVGIKID